jgi:hypothetical protein
MGAYLAEVITFGVGLLGVAVGYGALRNQVRSNTRDMAALRKRWADMSGGNPGGRPIYMPRQECEAKHGRICKLLEEQAGAVKGLQNYARHMLAKDKTPLETIDRILNRK